MTDALPSAGAAVLEAVAAADAAARRWRFDEDGAAPAGSDRHKRMFSQVMRETFNPYKPAVIPWPVLDPEAQQRLVSLPIWDTAVQVEGRARLRIRSYARTVQDPAVREALELMGFEEGRHKEVLSHLVAFYGIALKPEPDYVEPKDPERAFMTTGISECVDSFFAFGLFEMARRSGYFPEALVETFEPVIQEEGRHILFFTNWLAWRRRTMPWWRRPWFTLKTLSIWILVIRERISFARGMSRSEKSDAAFTLTSAQSVSNQEVDPADLMDICLAENDRRLAGYDPRLRRPNTVPRGIRLARLLIRPKRKRQA
ncbi:ferritin-like domain-containing protein [Mycobacterium sp. KBS0706]|nr:ferritin-like domain-containing protein [Mycobacterium sp. KBS0706]